VAAGPGLLAASEHAHEDQQAEHEGDEPGEQEQQDHKLHRTDVGHRVGRLLTMSTSPLPRLQVIVFDSERQRGGVL
jgi:hypothetical protein